MRRRWPESGRKFRNAYRATTSRRRPCRARSMRRTRSGKLLAEYCFRLDDGHLAETAALFAEGGSWHTAFGKATGRAAIAGLARNLRERAGPQRSRGIHLVTNIAIALDGASARVRSNWTVGPELTKRPSDTDKRT
jgi:hypothetical protein